MTRESLDLPSPTFGLPVRPAPSPTRVEWRSQDRTFVLSVVNFGLACCSVEFLAAVQGRAEAMAAGTIDARARHAGVVTDDGPRTSSEVLVISGTCTDALAPAVKVLYDQMPEPKRVVSFGACSNTGGPYWDSYSVTKGIDQMIPVDVYVPGCPPRPEALLGALGELMRDHDDQRGSVTP